MVIYAMFLDNFLSNKGYNPNFEPITNDASMPGPSANTGQAQSVEAFASTSGNDEGKCFIL